MMTTMLMKERDQNKTTQVTKMIPYLHACFAFCISLVSPRGLILLAFFTCYLQCKYFVWRRDTPIFFLIMRGNIFFLDFLTDSSSDSSRYFSIFVSVDHHSSAPVGNERCSVVPLASNDIHNNAT